MDIDTALRVEFRFGKYRGKTVGEILDADLLYLDFLNGVPWLHGAIKEAIGVVCEKYADEIERLLPE